MFPKSLKNHFSLLHPEPEKSGLFLSEKKKLQERETYTHTNTHICLVQFYFSLQCGTEKEVNQALSPAAAVIFVFLGLSDMNYSDYCCWLQLIVTAICIFFLHYAFKQCLYRFTLILALPVIICTCLRFTYSSCACISVC